MEIDPSFVSGIRAFCRVSFFLMLLPGLSGSRVPMRTRLFLAVFCSLFAGSGLASERDGSRVMAILVIQECGVGFMLGLTVRVAFEAFEFASNCIVAFLGIPAAGGGGDQGSETGLSSLLAVSSWVVVLVPELPNIVHALVIEDAAQSYSDELLLECMRRFNEGMRWALDTGLRLSGPILGLSLTVNLSFGVLGRLVPQVPTSFVAGPAVAIGGMMLLYMQLGTEKIFAYPG